MNGRSFVFVEANTSGTGVRFIEHTQRLGFQPVLLTALPALYRRLPPGLDVRVTNTLSICDMVRECQAHVSAISGVWTTSDYHVALAAELARQLVLPGPDPGSTTKVLNKQEQRGLLAKHKISQPLYHFVRTADEAMAVYRRLFSPQPVVLKPVNGSGKVGVRLVCTLEALKDQARVLEARTVNQRGLPVTPGFLLEQFVSGPEFSVETFDGRPVCIVAKKSGPPFFIEEGHLCPAKLDRVSALRLEEVTCAAVRALGLDWGPAHTELRMTSDGDCSVMEVNARLAGGCIPVLIQQAIGVDLIEATLLRALGREVGIVPSRVRFSAIAFRLLEAEGTVTKVGETARILDKPGVVEVAIYPQSGDHLLYYNDFRDRIGHAVSVADDPGTAMTVAESAASMISLVVE